MLRSLAGIFYEEGKDRDAIVVYHRLIQEKPTSPEAAFFQSRIVTCAGRMGRKDAAVQQAHVFVKMLHDIEGAARRARTRRGARRSPTRGATPSRRSASSRSSITTSGRRRATTRSQASPPRCTATTSTSSRTSPPPTRCGSSTPSCATRSPTSQGAGEEYERVALHDVRALEAKARPGEPPPKAGKFFKDALENAVFAWDLVAKKLDDEKKPAGAADPKKRLALAPQRQRLLDACNRYLKWQPKGDKWVEIAYKAARIYYQHNAFAEATDLFTRIALDHPAHELAGYSTNLVLDAYNLLGDWRNVNGWAKRFYANAKLVEAHPALKADLAKIIEESAFKVIEEKERAKDHEGAAEEYLAFVRDWPGSRLAPTALFNASVDYVKARRIDKAVEVRNLVLQKYPDHELAPAALYDNAEAYEAIAEFEKAAELYERYFEAWRASARPKLARRRAKAKAKAKGEEGEGAQPSAEAPRPAGAYDEKKATDGIINAAVFRAGLRQWAKAEAASRAYLETWPNGPDAPRIFLSLADLHAKQGQTAKQLKQLEEYQRRYAKDPDEWLGLQHQIAQLFEKAGNAPLARRAQAQGLEYWRRNKDKVKERGLAARRAGALRRARPGVRRVRPDLAQRRAEVPQGPARGEGEEAEEARGVVRAGGAASSRRSRRSARCTRSASPTSASRRRSTTRRSRRRSAATRSLVEEYKSLLSQQAEPLEAKAIDGLALAVNAARDYGVVNDCARQATAILVKHKPEEYGPSPEVAPRHRGVRRCPRRPRGYGLLAEVRGRPGPGRGPRRPDPTLPPLRVRTAGGQRGAAAAGRRDPRSAAARHPRTSPSRRSRSARKKKKAEPTTTRTSCHDDRDDARSRSSPRRSAAPGPSRRRGRAGARGEPASKAAPRRAKAAARAAAGAATPGRRRDRAAAAPPRGAPSRPSRRARSGCSRRRSGPRRSRRSSRSRRTGRTSSGSGGRCSTPRSRGGAPQPRRRARGGRGKLGEARAEYERARELKPTLRQAAVNLGVLLEKQGDPRGAAAVYAQCIRDFPDDAVARERLAVALPRRRASSTTPGGSPARRSCASRAPSARTGCSPASRSSGTSSTSRSSSRCAPRSSTPQDPELPCTVGQVLARQGDDAGAQAQFRKALALARGVPPGPLRAPRRRAQEAGVGERRRARGGDPEARAGERRRPARARARAPLHRQARRGARGVRARGEGERGSARRRCTSPAACSSRA